MPKKNRTVLRNYFQSGHMPSEEHFQNLIDSSLNLVEEGFDRSPDEGFKISTMGAQDELFSFYKYSGSKPLWKMQFSGKEGESIEWATVNKDAEGSDSEKPTLVLHQNGSVGIGRNDPRSTLDVAGYIQSEGRLGGLSIKVPATAEWHPITEPLDGCHGFEVTAGVGGMKRSGKYALLHAVALKAYSRRGWFAERLDRHRGIRVTQSCYRNRHNRLKLSWRPAVNEDGESLEENKYQLFIKTNCPYGAEDEYGIQVFLTRMWSDQSMDHSRMQNRMRLLHG